MQGRTVPGHKLSVYVASDDNGDMAEAVPKGCDESCFGVIAHPK